MPKTPFNVQSRIPEIASLSAETAAEQTGFQEFLKLASEIPGVSLLSAAKGVFNPEAAHKSDLSL